MSSIILDLLNAPIEATQVSNTMIRVIDIVIFYTIRCKSMAFYCDEGMME